MRKQYSRINWEAVKQDYLRENLRSDTSSVISLEALARKWSVSPGAVRNKSAEDGWREELDGLRDVKIKRALQAIAAAEGEEEGAIRVRQARIARLALSKAAAFFQSLDPATLNIREATTLLHVAMTQERAALGFSPLFNPVPEETASDYESVHRSMSRHRELVSLAEDLQRFITESDRNMIEVSADGEVEVIREG